jgi:hypothetical protein
MYLGLIVPAYSYAYFSPAIVKSLGFGNISTQLHSVPPWACAFAVGMAVAWASDRVRHRWAFAVVPALVGAAGFAVLLAHPASMHVRYGALFIAASGEPRRSPPSCAR